MTAEDRARAQREAARKIKKMRAEDVTVGLWLDGWRAFFPGEASDVTAQQQNYMLGPFRERHGRKLMTAVTPLMAQQWANRHPAQVKYLRMVWAKAQIAGIVPFNVWRIVELPRGRGRTKAIPTVAQFEAIVARCQDRGGWWQELADLLLFTAYTGARSAGVCGLLRGDVELVARRVTLREKGGKERRVALLGQSADAVARALERHILLDRVFLTSRRRPLERGTLGEAWRGVRGDFDGPFHSLRHFAGTWLAEHGVAPRDIAIQLGHTDKYGRPYTSLVLSTYIHPNHDAALERIEQAVG